MPVIRDTRAAIMLDLETLGTAPGNAVTSIGAVAWFPHNGNVFNEFKRNISIKSSLRYGMTVDGDTLAWWMKQSEAARLGMILDAGEMVSVLAEFTHWYSEINLSNEIAGLWAHGANFDPQMLEAAYRAINTEAPWHYRTPRDTRTLFALSGFDPKAAVRNDVEHDALADARVLAGWVTEALARLSAGVTV